MKPDDFFSVKNIFCLHFCVYTAVSRKNAKNLLIFQLKKDPEAEVRRARPRSTSQQISLTSLAWALKLPWLTASLKWALFLPSIQFLSSSWALGLPLDCPLASCGWMSRLILLNFGPRQILDQELSGNSSMKLSGLSIALSRSSSRPRTWAAYVFFKCFFLSRKQKSCLFLQFEYFDYLDQNRTFGPIFNHDEFLLPLLELQNQIVNLTVKFNDKVITLKDVCNNPMSRPDKANGICNIQSIWSYWQDSLENLDKVTPAFEGKKNLTYLDHFLKCARYIAF